MFRLILKCPARGGYFSVFNTLPTRVRMHSHVRCYQELQAGVSPRRPANRLWTSRRHRVIRRVLMNCVRPAPDSLFGDVPDLDSKTAADITKDREKRKASGLQSVANHFMGNCSKTKYNDSTRHSQRLKQTQRFL